MRLVQRRQRRQRVQLLDDLDRKPDRCGKIATTMNHAVPYRRQGIRLHVFLCRGQQRTQHGVVLCVLTPPVLVRQRRASRIRRGEMRVATDALDFALRHDAEARAVVDLELRWPRKFGQGDKLSPLA